MSRVQSLRARVLDGVLICLASACATTAPAGAWTPELAPTEVTPASAAEVAVLAQASRLPSDVRVDVAGVSVIAAVPYHAASGRVCRALRVDEQPRLACEGHDGWVFVPVLVEGP